MKTRKQTRIEDNFFIRVNKSAIDDATKELQKFADAVGEFKPNGEVEVKIPEVTQITYTSATGGYINTVQRTASHDDRQRMLAMFGLAMGLTKEETEKLSRVPEPYGIATVGQWYDFLTEEVYKIKHG